MIHFLAFSTHDELEVVAKALTYTMDCSFSTRTHKTRLSLIAMLGMSRHTAFQSACPFDGFSFLPRATAYAIET